MTDSYLKQYVGKRIVVYLSTWSRFINYGVIGVVSECKDGWIELKKKNNIEHIRSDKICSFRVLE
ncbi:MAG: DUF6897 domain-containing protein [Bacillota bacterium]